MWNTHHLTLFWLFLIVVVSYSTLQHSLTYLPENGLVSRIVTLHNCTVYSTWCTHTSIDNCFYTCTHFALQEARIEFVNNTAGIAGAAIYANDMSRCKWLGPNNYTEDFFIFDTPLNYMSPFLLK